MSYKIIIRPEAEADISESFRWYQGKVPGFGIEGDNIIVLAVLHAKRDPTVSKKRRSK